MDTKKIIADALKKYEYLADEALRGDFSHLDYAPAQNAAENSFDANSISRLRLVTLMPFVRPDAVQEEILLQLFRAETECCQNHDNGYDVLQDLAGMLLNFHDADHYREIFAAAREANFDCFCGFDPADIPPAAPKDLRKFDDYSPADCVTFLYFDLGMREELFPCLDAIEAEYAGDLAELYKLRFINEELGRDSHNLNFYRLNLQKQLSGGDAWDITSAFEDVISAVLPQDKDKAFAYFEQARPYLRQCEQHNQCNLWFYYTVFAAEFIAAFPEHRARLWAEWKQYIIPGVTRLRNPDTNRKLLHAAELAGDTQAVKKMKHLLAKH